MTQRTPGAGNSGPAWPVVALSGLAMAAVVVILIWVPPDDARGGQVVVTLVAVLSALAGGTYAARRVEAGSAEVAGLVAEVRREVNGRMSELIEKVPTPAPPAGDTPPDVPGPRGHGGVT